MKKVTKKKAAKKKVSKKKPSEIEAVKMILAGAAALNWRVSFNVEDEDAPVDYLILGCDREVDRIVDCLEKHG